MSSKSEPAKTFTQAMFKVNVSGSWANLVWCDPSRYEAVKAACATLAQAAGHEVRFKAIDVAGGVLEMYGPLPRGNGACGWHTPKTAFPIAFPTSERNARP